MIDVTATVTCGVLVATVLGVATGAAGLVGPAADLAAFQELCGSLMSVPLERDRPLWELLVVPGLPTDTVGIILRIHHAIADGMAAADIVQRLSDPGDGAAVAGAGDEVGGRDAVHEAESRGRELERGVDLLLEGGQVACGRVG